MTDLYEQFLKVANARGDEIAIVTPKLSISYKELLKNVVHLSNVIQKLAGADRPRVGMLTDMADESAAISLALAKLGGVCVPANPQLKTQQLESGWNSCDVNMVIGGAKYADKVKNLKFIAHDNLFALEQLMEMSAPNTDVQYSGEDFLITLSSGSTGNPKPIVISQRAKLGRALHTHSLYHLDSNDVMLCASPFFHSLGQRLTFVPLLVGAKLIQLPSFSAEAWLSAVSQYKVTFIIAVSSHLYALKSKLLEYSSKISSLKTIVSSSAPIDANFKQLLFTKVGCDFHEIYGATEVAVATNLSPRDATLKHQTVGNPCEGVQIKILNDNKDELGVNAVGEIAVKTPLVFSGYYNQIQLTENSMFNGYFLTGDLGSLDSDGFLTYVGRKKDIIISGGINIYPKDIENVISSHPRVTEVAVIGVADEILGETVIAICVANEDIDFELRTLVNRELAPFQRPVKFYFRDSLPLTATGKVSKLLLREEFSHKTHELTNSIFGLMRPKS